MRAAVFSATAASASCKAKSSPPRVDATVDVDATVAADIDAAKGTVEVRAVVDLPRTSSTRELSGAVFEASTRTLFALTDAAPRITPIVASPDYKSWSLRPVIPLRDRQTSEWDGEGLALRGDEFYAVTVETTARIERFDRSGHRLGALPMPARFANDARENQGLESLAITPSGRFLVTANESALVTDGPGATRARGTVVRILRRDLAGGGDREFAYRTDPVGAGKAIGDLGVSEIAALSDDVLLVLERGHQSGYGNTVRMYRVELTDARDTKDVARLDGDAPVLPKRLLVDVGTLSFPSAVHPGAQPNPILENYEGLALGPRLDDGRLLVFLTSDDNGNSDQVPRILVLAVRDS